MDLRPCIESMNIFKTLLYKQEVAHYVLYKKMLLPSLLELYHTNKYILNKESYT